jgi:CheY-like chemotaxis protein
MSAPQMVVPAPVVLVVDDEPTLLYVMEHTLSQAGYEVYGSSNALRALALATSLRVPPAVLVSDVRMEPDEEAVSRRPFSSYGMSSGRGPSIEVTHCGAPACVQRHVNR